ncbi:MAG: phenylalanyl-tRNA synthetase alpha chain [Parcubacteria group bacterium Gr01-1014_29]|nr:MAG: phenylalanyl-tRNA synthetase alpha chain [Parcubacteria group bacterium Gr01-1014_29]
MQNLEELKQEALTAIRGAERMVDLRDVEVKYLGRRGLLTEVLRGLKDVPEKERKEKGMEANTLRELLELEIATRRSQLQDAEYPRQLEAEKIDITQPGRKYHTGSLHPLTLVQREVQDILGKMGFSTVRGPEVELEWYNFDSLNLPKYHPARDMQDTLWLDEKPVALKKRGENILSRLLMRTQVTSIQVRFMEKNNPPFAIVMPGNVFRREASDASHESQFSQMDGLAVGPDASLANLKWVMETVMKKLFGSGVKTRLRPSYFPFTEPSVELDMECLVCQGRGCSVCKKTGWIEVLPGGMVHPRVFEAAGYNPRENQGYAFDIGIDRIAMMKYGVPDIRLFRSQDLRFINQF